MKAVIVVRQTSLCNVIQQRIVCVLKQRTTATEPNVTKFTLA